MSAPGLATRATSQDGTLENSPTADRRQVAVLPSLAAARQHLVEVIRQRPAPIETDAQAHARQQRAARLADAQRKLACLPAHLDAIVAGAIGLTPRALRRWRTGQRAPRWCNWRRLCALAFLVQCRPEDWS